jgi:hypothetical protein
MGALAALGGVAFALVIAILVVLGSSPSRDPQPPQGAGETGATLTVTADTAPSPAVSPATADVAPSAAPQGAPSEAPSSEPVPSATATAATAVPSVKPTASPPGTTRPLKGRKPHPASSTSFPRGPG